jgi:cyclic pyranopterin phosphate synthase
LSRIYSHIGYHNSDVGTEHLAETLTTDAYGRHVKEVRFRLGGPNPFKLIYRAPEEVATVGAGQEPLTAEQILVLTRMFVELGADHFLIACPVISGSIDVPQLVGRMKALSGVKKVTLTTMGTDLAPAIESLKAAGLDEIHVNLDTLRTGRYTKVTGTSLLPQALQGLDCAFSSGIPVKINMVVMNGVNADELGEFHALAKEHDSEVRFIELVPFSQDSWKSDATVKWSDTKADLESLVPLVPLPAEDHGELMKFHTPGEPGIVTFVRSLSESFCSTCDRVRVKADGRIQSCQFSKPDARVRDALIAGKPESDITLLLRETLAEKPQCRPELLHLQEMIKERA